MIAGTSPAANHRPTKTTKRIIFSLHSSTRKPHLTTPLPTQFENVTATAKANVYHDGGVISHTIVFADGARKTLGLIFPGTYYFDTDAPERMDITAGTCKVRLDSEDKWTDYAEGESFDVPGKSGFEIDVLQGETQYICSFL